MLGTVLLVILILMLVGALPTWGHSRNWGYLPSGGLGLVVAVLLILVLLGRIYLEKAMSSRHADSNGDMTVTRDDLGAAQRRPGARIPGRHFLCHLLASAEGPPIHEHCGGA